MASFVFNISKGRVTEYYNRVENNDPSASALGVVVLKTSTGIEATMKDVDTITALLATAADEVTGTGWNRKTLTDADLAALPAPDDTNDRYEVSVPTFNWTPDAAADDATGLVVFYNAAGTTSSGGDSSSVPLTYHDFVVAADGNQVVVNAGVFFRAAESP